MKPICRRFLKTKNRPRYITVARFGYGQNKAFRMVARPGVRKTGQLLPPQTRAADHPPRPPLLSLPRASTKTAQQNGAQIVPPFHTRRLTAENDIAQNEQESDHPKKVNPHCLHTLTFAHAQLACWALV